MQPVAMYKESAAESIEVVSGRDEYYVGNLPRAGLISLLVEHSDRAGDPPNFLP